MSATKMTLHHVRLPRWMAEGIRELGEGTSRKDSVIIRAAINEYLAKYGITEEDFLARQFNQSA